MREALLFRENEEKILVTAEEVKNGVYSRYEEFVDPEYEYKVQFVKGARNGGGPYFRLYYSYEDYKKLYPERASRYEIVANMRRYEESSWHKRWKEKVADFCAIEKLIKCPVTQKRRFADAFYDEMQTCIEFQHSYIALDFEERCVFYKGLSIKTIWLYDLPKANAKQDEKGNIELLEDNARGFFRISNNPDNLKKNFVYIQVKSGMIYRVTELLRREASTEKKSTIRYFSPSEVYTEKEFVDAIKDSSIGVEKKEEKGKTLGELWKKNYKWMKARNGENGDVIYINRNHLGNIYRNYSTGNIQYTYADGKYGEKHAKEYELSQHKENRPIWFFVAAKIIGTP